MAERSPRHGLTRGNRGWYRRVGGIPKWICSNNAAPTGADADRIFEERFKDLARPARAGGAMPVEEMFDLFIARKRESVEAGTLSVRTVGDYIDTGARFVAVVGGIRAVDVDRQHFAAFARAIEGYSPSRRAKLVITLKTAFKWAASSGVIPRLPNFGSELRVPGKPEFRRHRAKKGQQFYSPEEIAKLREKAYDHLNAMILLALNGGLGNADLSALPWSAVDLDAALIRYHRGKTGIERIIPLWAESVAALRKLKSGERVFVYPDGRPWVDDGNSHHDRIAVEFGRLCLAAGVVNRGFYSLRRTFRTAADEAGDQRAAAAIMGHEVGDVGGIYVQRIGMERLKAVIAHVHDSVLGAGESSAVRGSKSKRHGRAAAKPRSGRPAKSPRRNG